MLFQWRGLETALLEHKRSQTYAEGSSSGWAWKLLFWSTNSVCGTKPVRSGPSHFNKYSTLQVAWMTTYTLDALTCKEQVRLPKRRPHSLLFCYNYSSRLRKLTYVLVEAVRFSQILGSIWVSFFQSTRLNLCGNGEWVLSPSYICMCIYII